VQTLKSPGRPCQSIAQIFIFNAFLQVIKKIGAYLLEDIKDAPRATVVIAGDKTSSMRRTPKLMIGMCNTGSIVDLRWLVESGKAQRALPPEDFLLKDDKEAEDKYSFSMHTSINRAKQLRSNNEKVFSGWSVHVCRGVAGNKAPPQEELKLIVQQSGTENDGLNSV
jgi:hypothetical protein